MKTKKAIKYILKNPKLFTDGDRQYVKLIKKQRELKKQNEKRKNNFSNS